MSGAFASQIIEKLAFIPQFCYITVDFGGVDWPLFERLIQRHSSLSGGEKPANQGLTRPTTPFGRAVGSLVLAGSMALSAPAFAKDKAPTPAVQTSVPVQTVAFQNPYISACDEHTTQKYDAACRDAAKGTVVILMKSDEFNDAIRDGFLSAAERRYGDTIPIEFRDTDGPTTVFMFDKNMQIDQDMIVNGSLLYAIGIRYPEKIVALNGPTPAGS